MLAIGEHWLAEEVPRVAGYRWLEVLEDRAGREPGVAHARGTGVAFLVKDSLVPQVTVQRGVSGPRTLWITLRAAGAAADTHVCSLYAPTATRGADEYGAFLGEVGASARALVAKHGGSVVLLGDFNVDLRKDSARARALSTLFLKLGIEVPRAVLLGGPPTYSKAGHTSMIDYIACPPVLLQQYEVREDLELCTDHRMVLATLAVPKGGGKTVAAKWDWPASQARATDWTRYKRVLKGELAGFVEWAAALEQGCPESARRSTLDSVSTLFTNVVLRAADEGLGLVRRRSPGREWWNEELDKLAATRSEWWSRKSMAGSCASAAVVEGYKAARKTYTRAVRRQKRCKWSAAWAGVARDRDEGLARLWWRESKKLRGKARPVLADVYVQGSGGRTTQTMEERKEVWSKYYSEVAKDPGGTWHPACEDLTPARAPEWGGKPTSTEVALALKHTNPWKAGGGDEVAPHLLTKGGKVVVDALTALFGLAHTWTMVPQSWKDSVICPIYKGGDPLDKDNYRPISLLSTIGKTMERVVQVNLSKAVEGNNLLSDQQLGFRPKIGTLESILWLTEVLKARKARGLATYIAFLDIRKAYDTVWHGGLWGRLSSLGLSTGSAQVLKDWHTNMRAQVRVGMGETTDPHRVSRGVRQGGVSSATLYTLFIDTVNDDLREGQTGIFEEGVWCGNSMYADDMGLMAGSEEELQAMLDIVERHSHKWRYEYSPTKCKVLVVGQRSPHKARLRLCGQEMEVVEEFKYLGLWITSNLKWNSHVDHMVDKTNRRVGELLIHARRVGGMSGEVALHLWCAEVRPIIEYAVAIWGVELPAYLVERLEKLQRKVLRRLLWLGATTANAAVLSETAVDSIQDRIDKLSLNLWGKLYIGAGGGHQVQAILAHRLRGEVPEWSWCSRVLGVAARHQLDPVKGYRGPRTSVPLWLEEVEETLKWERTERLREELLSLSKTQLLCRVLRRDGFGQISPYAKHSHSLGARLLGRLRTGTNGLEVEMRRPDGIPRADRTCRVCQETLEDELHFLGECPAYAEQRQGWWRAITKRAARAGQQDRDKLARLAIRPRKWALLVLRGGTNLSSAGLSHAVQKESARMVGGMWVRRHACLDGMGANV